MVFRRNFKKSIEACKLYLCRKNPFHFETFLFRSRLQAGAKNARPIMCIQFLYGRSFSSWLFSNKKQMNAWCKMYKKKLLQNCQNNLPFCRNNLFLQLGEAQKLRQDTKSFCEIQKLQNKKTSTTWRQWNYPSKKKL